MSVIQLPGPGFHTPPGCGAGPVPIRDPRPVLVYEAQVVVTRRDGLRSSGSIVCSRRRSRAVALFQRPVQGLNPDELLVLRNPLGHVTRWIAGPPMVLLARERAHGLIMPVAF